jgi:hypothetical protein
VWVGVLTGILLLEKRWDTWSGPWGLWFVVVVVVPAWRMLDLLRWYADLLVDRAHSHLMSTERNLVFVLLNLIEVTLICGIWLRASTPQPTTGSALFDSFGMTSQVGGLPDAGGAATHAGIAMAEITALVLLIGGVAILVGEVQEKIRATGGWWGTRRG